MKIFSMAVWEFRPKLVGIKLYQQDYRTVIQHQVGSFYYYLLDNLHSIITCDIMFAIIKFLQDQVQSIKEICKITIWRSIKSQNAQFIVC